MFNKHAIAKALPLSPLFRGLAKLRCLPLISYSQCGEDRFLSTIGNLPDTGFYVDIGAAHPYYDSNTFAFYTKGWRGLTIEPNAHFSHLHSIVRPRDRQIRMGIAGDQGELTYFQFDNPHLNTFDSTEKEKSLRLGARLKGQETIATAPLTHILSTNNVPDPVDVMSVDCEGFDLQALQSNNWDQYRPHWLIVEDLEAYESFNRPSAIYLFLTAQNYSRIAQVGFSTFYKDGRG